MHSPLVLDTQKFMLPEQNRRRTSSELISGSTGKEKTTQFYLFYYQNLCLFLGSVSHEILEKAQNSLKRAVMAKKQVDSILDNVEAA